MLLSCSPVVIPTMPTSRLSLFATGVPLATTNGAVKRGSDELLSNGDNASLTNGDSFNSRSVMASENNNDVKKPKLDKNVGKPSKVVHIRNIPSDVSETEIIHLGIPFGRVTNVLVLKGKNQAFLEMQDENAASTMVTYFTTCTATLRGRAVYIQFSNHKELRTDHSHSNANASAQAALQAAQVLNGQSETQGGPNTILRVIIEHMLYPITLEVIHQIFTRYGSVLKIVTFTKNNTFQVLIQYPDVVSAQSAKLSLDGQNIYSSCCTLRIEFSKLTNLNVRYNNEKSRDFTNPALPKCADSTSHELPLSEHNLLPQVLLTGGTNGVQTATTRRSINQAECLAGLSVGAFSLTSSPTGLAITGPCPFAAAPSSVLLVSNLNEDMISPDSLFTLFGVYGDVLRVKILFNKKDSALIQMAEAQQAQLAMMHVDRIRLYGKEVRVMQSKYNTVQLPKNAQIDVGLTKDYTSSPLHRYKKPGSKNYQNIYSPSSTLHLSNIPSTVTEQNLVKAFRDHNFQVKDFRFFPKDRRMALIELTSIEEATIALIKMHNYKLGDQSHLRVSFSKLTIQQDNRSPK